MMRAALALVLVTACGPRELSPDGHVVLSVTTDAPLPPPAGAAPASEALPLFDRLRIEIYAPGEDQPCAGCTREVPVDAELLSPASFSLTGAGQARVRLRLYRSGQTTSGTARARSTIETVVLVPEAPDSGRRDAHVILRTEAVGTPTGTLAAPIPAEPGRAPNDRVGSWSGGQVVPCSSAAQAGEACIVGGAQWRGDPRLDLSAYPDLGGAEEQLVVLSPFFLDLTEVTVAAFRASGLAVRPVPGGPSDNPHEKDTGIANCTYSSEPSDSDPLAVNCVSWSLARAYCESQGKRLPTEAELERAASALGRHPFVWGEDQPRCEDAVFGRGTPGKPCIGLGVGVEPPGTGARDHLPVGESDVVDLVGNVAEWTADRHNDQWPVCFAPALAYDPRCDALSTDGNEARVFRGGHFGSDAPLLRASIYSWIAFEEQAVSATIGIRCARDGD